MSTTQVLTERCCYWELYTEKFKVPEQTVEGTAAATVPVPLKVFPLELSSNRIEAATE